MGSMNKLFYCFLLTTLLCGCKERKEPQAPVRQPVTTEYVEKGNQRVRSLNQRNAGFVSTAMQTVEVSEQCFGVKEPSLLDRLPRVDDVSRKDSALISQLNEGDVFLLQPGEKRTGADGRCDQDARALSGGRIVDLEIECHPAGSLRDWGRYPLDCSFYYFVKKVYPKTVLALRRFWKNRTYCFSHRQTFFEFSSHDKR